MQLTINIEDEELQKVVQRGIDNLSDESVAEIAKEAITQFLMQPDAMAMMAFEKQNGLYSTRPDYDRPRKWFENLLASVFTPEDFKAEKTAILGELVKDRKNILIEVLAASFSRNLLTYEMQAELQRQLYERYNNC